MRSLKTVLTGSVLALMIGAGVTLHAQGYSFSSVVQKTVTLTTATISPAFKAMYTQLVLTPATTVTATTNAVEAIRGEIDLTTGKTFTDGFLYGVAGRAIFAGTLNQSSAGRVTGTLGKVDTTGSTLTSGQVNGVWADLVGNAANAETYPLRVSNSMSVSPPALAIFVGHATAALDLSDLGNGSSGDFVINASGTSAGQCAQTGGVVFTKTLKIVADGTTYYIGLCTAP